MRSVLAVVLLVLAPAVAGAHIVVVPDQSEAGSWERYTVLVPTEKESATVRVQVRLPNGINVIAVEAKPGWEGHYDPFPIGAARVEWKGGRIPPEQFVSFEFLAWNPPAARVLTWEATQWYEDGTSDKWGAGDPEHASTTTLKPSSGHEKGMHHHGDGAPPPQPAGSPKR
jgi:uncharacterized protein YcnI